MRKLASIVALWLFAVAAHAQGDSGPYIGVAAGSFSYQEADAQLGLFIDDTTTTYRVIGGYQVNESLAIEGAIGKTGDIKESFPLISSGSLDLTAEYELVTVRALGLVPVGRVDLFGGIGYFDATVNVAASATGFGLLGEAEEDDSGATLLGGVHFYLDNVTIRGEYEWFDTDGDLEVWDITIGVLFRF
jgi:opacity protein-like surface antigen